MQLTRDRLRHLVVHVPEGTGEVLQFAAAELSDYLQRITGVRLAVRPDASLSGARLTLGAAPRVDAPSEPDAFVVAPTDDGVALAGASERAVLYAVYRLLAALGCAWSFHGREQESVPAGEEGLRVPELRHAPRYRIRAYTSDLHTWHYTQPELFFERLPADRGFVDWMPKTGANGFFFIRHPFDSQLGVPELLPEFTRRGIVPEYGGHVLPLLLPRELFAAHPEYFPVGRDGRRNDMGNVCTSNSDALRVVTDNAVRYVRETPEMGVLHIWGADLWDGGWCACAACAALSVQDQSLRVCNAVGEALATAGLHVPVCYLAYHDTIKPNLTIDPSPTVLVEFAPRERCYGHALDDETCRTNRRYREAFERYVERFDGRVRVFEYYGDSILFCGCAVPLTAVIDADLDYYHRAGAGEITFLQFGTHSLWAHPLNFLRFAAATWGETDTAATHAFCRRAGNLDLQLQYWGELEAAMREVVTYGDIRRPPRQRAADIRAAIERARPVLRRWRERLAGNDRTHQASLLAYTDLVLEGVTLQLADAATARQEALGCYERALDIIRATDRGTAGLWGATDLPIIHAYHTAGMDSEKWG